MLFKKKQENADYNEFWKWFQIHQKKFHDIISSENNIEEDFFDPLSEHLDKITDGIFYLTGMYDETTVELILTPDGNINKIIFIEELVMLAPQIDGWIFTALKPALDINDVCIEMDDYVFDKSNLSFYANENLKYPDEIDITIVHPDFNEEKEPAIANGIFLFLDNYLGELYSTTTIDSIQIIGPNEVSKELIPIAKLKDYLKWREKEFIEKYDGIRYGIDNDKYAIFNAESKSGNPFIAMINTDLLQWNSKASHPWMLNITIKFDGKHNNGMPDKKTQILLDKIEDEITEKLKDLDGNLNIGRETGENTREIYIACKDFRMPSKALSNTVEKYASKIEIDFDIYKDKYWQTLNRFMPENTVI